MGIQLPLKPLLEIQWIYLIIGFVIGVLMILKGIYEVKKQRAAEAMKLPVTDTPTAPKTATEYLRQKSLAPSDSLPSISKSESLDGVSASALAANRSSVKTSESSKAEPSAELIDLKKFRHQKTEDLKFKKILMGEEDILAEGEPVTDTPKTAKTLKEKRNAWYSPELRFAYRFLVNGLALTLGCLFLALAKLVGF